MGLGLGLVLEVGRAQYHRGQLAHLGRRAHRVAGRAHRVAGRARRFAGYPRRVAGYPRRVAGLLTTDY